MKKKYLSREEILRNKFSEELNKPKPSIDSLIVSVNEFEEANLATIEKLMKGKKVDMKRINGALKQTIQSHGDITMDLLSSASKRVYGSMLEGEESKIKNHLIINKNPYSIRGILLGIVISLFIFGLIKFL